MTAAFPDGPADLLVPLAHGVGRSADLPLPLDLVLQAGAATVVISFLASALLWRRPVLTHPRERHPRPTWWRRPLRLLVLALALYLTAAALVGPREHNPAAHALFVWLWVGLIPVSVLFGPVWRALNPIRTLAELLHIGTREPAHAPDRAPARVPGPAPATTVLSDPAPPAAQSWVAGAGLLAFVWLELVALGRADPVVLGLCVAGYAGVQLALVARHGAQWPARGDFLEVYSDLAGRLSPLRWRPPLSGLTADHPAGAGRAAFLAIWWGSTIFDSASGSPAWAGFVQRSGVPLLWSTAGLLAVCGIVFAAVRWLPGRLDVTNSLIPIAVGYTLAHYLTLLLVEGPRGALLLVQQWGLAHGATWDVVPDPHVISVLQVTLILGGHALGVLAAHDMALAGNPGRPPSRSVSTPGPRLAPAPPSTQTLAVLAEELPVVLFMILCTWAGLFLLFVR
ncbi:hypothetical protein ACFQS1_01635 [Paractinoplanes rhizophilus]|uniref:Uncharacterized protein n=1 Tax=Paractinoplanes rhizophilus TaxID=1416877 RepID=A0ABW2HHH4_9ACTN